MTTPDETLHFSDDEREVFRLRAKVAALETELSTQKKATGEEMGKRETMERNWNDLCALNNQCVARAETAEAKVRTLEADLADYRAAQDQARVLAPEWWAELGEDGQIAELLRAALKDRERLERRVASLEECNRLSNESALQSAGRIRELESLLSRTLDNCKFYADELKDEVRDAIRARGKS